MFFKRALVFLGVCGLSISALADNWTVNIVNNSGHTIQASVITRGTLYTNLSIPNNTNRNITLTHSDDQYSYLIDMYGINACEQIVAYGNVKAEASANVLTGKPYHRSLNVLSDPYQALNPSGNTITVTNIAATGC